MDKKTLVIANWKCNPQTWKEAKRLFELVEGSVKDAKNIEVVICAPSVYLGLLKIKSIYGVTSVRALSSKKNNSLAAITPKNIQFGAQDCFWEQRGPYTGEVSPSMLKNIGCEYVIIGHSEQRKYFGETDEIINKKLKAALSVRLKPVLCIGEKEEEREQIKGVLENQLSGCLRDIKQGQISNIIFVYEPVWAISTSGGQFCSPDDAFSAGLLMRKFLMDRYGKYAGNKVKIIYGGSVDAKEKSAVMYIKEAKMDGVLVGAASLKAEEFGKIISSVAEM